VDELTKMVKSLSAKMEKMKFEGKQGYKNVPNTDNKGNLKRKNNHAPQIMLREQKDKDGNDQKIKNPLQNNLLIDEEREEEEHDPKIHFIGDTSPFTHLTQYAYEESLMNSQINEPSKGEKAISSPDKYNLRSKKKEGKSDIPDHPSIPKKPIKDVVNNNKEKKAQNPSPVAKDPSLEVREIRKPSSSFSFEH
jgi:hypothetical protein